MKKILFMLLMGSLTYVQAAKKPVHKKQRTAHQQAVSQGPAAQTYLLDTIESVVFSTEGTELITRSEMLLPSLQGGSRDLNDMIFEILVYFDAKKHKIEPNEDAVDRYLVKIMKENNLKREDLETIFSQGGRTYKQGREELKRVQAVNGMIDFKIRSNLIVPRKDVEAYYNEHPEIQPARYQLQYAQVNLNADATEADYTEMDEKLNEFRKTGKGIDIDWRDPFWVEKDDLAQDKQFIVNMYANEISQPIKVGSGFQVYRMITRQEEKQRSIDERYREIVEILLQPIYTKLLTEYRSGLFENASIVRLK